MGWFFDQWVYGVDVPTYRPDLKVSRVVDRSTPYLLHGTIGQEDVPDNFRMPVPILVRFETHPPVASRVWVDADAVEVEIPAAGRTHRGRVQLPTRGARTRAVSSSDPTKFQKRFHNPGGSCHFALLSTAEATRSVRWAARTTGRSTNRPSTNKTPPWFFSYASTTLRAHATSSASGENASWITDT